MVYFNFATHEAKLAITAADEDIFPHLPFKTQTYFYPFDRYPEALCSGIIASGCLEPQRGSRPEETPFTRRDLQSFSNFDFSTMRGFWSVYWLGGNLVHSDIIYDDGFRSVVVCGAIELMIRPVEEFKPGRYITAPHRIHLTRADIKSCVDAALLQNPGNRMRAVIGSGLVLDPDKLVSVDDRTKENSTESVAFEWKIDRDLADRVHQRVKKWRYDACGGYEMYTNMKHNYLKAIADFGESGDRQRSAERVLAVQGQETAYQQGPEPGSAPRYHMSPVQPGQWPTPQDAAQQRGKRTSWEMSGGQELSPSLKRRSMGSQASSASQPGSASQSAVSSPEMSRPPSVAASPGRQVMGPPPLPPPAGTPRPIRQPRSRRGSSVGSGLAGMTIGSPGRGSPAGVLPPPAGSPWGVPVPPGGVATAPGQLGGGYAPQAPGYGQQPTAYGHDFQPSPPLGPPRVGFPYSQYTATGEWTPPQPQQMQQFPMAQAPARSPPLPSPAGSAPAAHPGGGYDYGHWGRPDVPAPGPGPDIPGGGGYVYPPVGSGAGQAMLGNTNTATAGPNVWDFLAPSEGASSGGGAHPFAYQGTSEDLGGEQPGEQGNVQQWQNWPSGGGQSG